MRHNNLYVIFRQINILVFIHKPDIYRCICSCCATRCFFIPSVCLGKYIIQICKTVTKQSKKACTSIPWKFVTSICWSFSCYFLRTVLASDSVLLQFISLVRTPCWKASQHTVNYFSILNSLKNQIINLQGRSISRGPKILNYFYSIVFWK